MKSTFGHKLALFKFDTVLNYFYFVPFSYSFLADVVHTPRPYLEQLLSITVGDQGLILESEGSDPIENLSSPARGPTQSITFKFRFHPYCFGNL